MHHSTGKQYLEGMAGLWCTGLGYNHRELIECISEQMSRLSFTHMFGGKTHRPGMELADKLAGIMLGMLGDPRRPEAGTPPSLANRALLITALSICHESGEKAFEGTIVDYQRIGTWRYWHRDGSPHSEGEGRGGRRAGEWTLYFKGSGRIQVRRKPEDRVLALGSLNPDDQPNDATGQGNPHGHLLVFGLKQ